ncbi:unnamed protein product [Prorocentrum cordatum]|uniref:Meiosis-specific nuclear structural protein 1 n=1 Tax=Prorocentrum cordatum TaxID=2364126 RepID=A0ABN9SRA1_9DINO|nr:unnamed protein product [Polarella glacialis]
MAGPPQPKRRIGGAPFAVLRASHRPPSAQAPRKAGPPPCARGRVDSRPPAAAAARGLQASQGGAPSSARHPRADVAEQRIAERRSGSPTAELYAKRAARFAEEVASGKIANEWTVVQELAAADQQRREDDERRKRAAGRQQLAAQLRAQEEEMRQQRETRKEESKAWAETVKKDVAAYQREQAQTKANLMERHKRLDEDMRRNLEEQERQKKVQRESEERTDKEILDRQLQASRRADERERRAKREERERSQFLFEERRSVPAGNSWSAGSRRFKMFGYLRALPKVHCSHDMLLNCIRSGLINLQNSTFRRVVNPQVALSDSGLHPKMPKAASETKPKFLRIA